MSKSNRPMPILRDNLISSLSLGGGGGGGGEGCNCDMSNYLTVDDATNTYQKKGDYATLSDRGRVPYSQLPEDIGGGCVAPDLTDYLKTADADKKYQAKGNYLTQHQSLADCLKTADADKKYQPIGSGGDGPDLSSYLKTVDADNKYQPKGEYLTAHQSLGNCVKYNNLKVPIESVTVDETINYLKTNIDNRITGEQDDFYNAIVTAKYEGYRVSPEITAPNGISIELQLPDHKAETMNGSGFVIEIEDIGDNHKKKYIALFFIISGRYTTVPYEFTDQLFNPSEPQWRYDNNGKYIVDIDEVKNKVTNPNVVNWVFINREYHESQTASENKVDASHYIEYTMNKGNAGGYCPLNKLGKIVAQYLPTGNNSQVTNPSDGTEESPSETAEPLTREEVQNMICPMGGWLMTNTNITNPADKFGFDSWIGGDLFELTALNGNTIAVKFWTRTG